MGPSKYETVSKQEVIKNPSNKLLDAAVAKLAWTAHKLRIISLHYNR